MVRINKFWKIFLKAIKIEKSIKSKQIKNNVMFVYSTKDWAVKDTAMT